MTKPLVPKTSFWNTDVVCQDEVDIYLQKYWNDSTIVKGSDTWTPPIFLYYESRDEQNYVDARALYGGGYSPTINFAAVENREIIALTGIDTFLVLSNNIRGEILAAFSQIEFVLDVIMCSELGAYQNTRNIKRIEKTFKADGLFSTTYSKLEYLKLKNVIDKETLKWVSYALQIRNNLAHSFLPAGDYGIETSVLKKFNNNHLEAIDYIFNASWFYILKAHVPLQIDILQWLESDAYKNSGSHNPDKSSDSILSYTSSTRA